MVVHQLLKSYKLPPISVDMRFFEPHILLSFVEYVVLGLGVYFLFIGFLCRFLAFGERSDEIRSQLRAGLDPFREEKSEFANRSRLGSRSSGYFRA